MHIDDLKLLGHSRGSKHKSSSNNSQFGDRLKVSYQYPRLLAFGISPSTQQSIPTPVSHALRLESVPELTDTPFRLQDGGLPPTIDSGSPCQGKFYQGFPLPARLRPPATGKHSGVPVPYRLPSSMGQLPAEAHPTSKICRCLEPRHGPYLGHSLRNVYSLSTLAVGTKARDLLTSLPPPATCGLPPTHYHLRHPRELSLPFHYSTHPNHSCRQLGRQLPQRGQREDSFARVTLPAIVPSLQRSATSDQGPKSAPGYVHQTVSKWSQGGSLSPFD